MPKSNQSPPRKPVKAKGALPAPVTAPERQEVPWYRRPRNLAIAAIAVVFLTVLGVKTGMDLAERADQRERQTRALEQFQRRIQLLNADIGPIFEQASNSPGAYLAGALPEEEFQAQADDWVETFRRYSQGLRETDVPEDMERLQESRGLFLQSALIYLDGAKTFALAPSIGDAARREEALVLARNELLHASAVLSMAERRFVDAQNELGLNDPPADLPQVQLPEEEAPIPPPSPALSPAPVESPAAQPAGPAGPVPEPAGTQDPAGPQPAG